MRFPFIHATCFASLLLLAACSSTATQPAQQTLPDWYKAQTKAATTPTTPPSNSTSNTTATTTKPASAKTSTTAAVAPVAHEQAGIATSSKHKDTRHAKTTVASHQEKTSATASSVTPSNVAPTVAIKPTTPTAANDSSNTNQAFTQQHPLEPFQASFRIYVSKIPMPITAELELKPLSQPDTWKMRFEVHSFMMHNLEESTFTWNNCHPKSIHYHHDFKGFGKHQFHDTSFYWKPPHVENHSDEDDKSFTIPVNSVDDLTVLLQAACVFSEGATDYYATSIYGDQIRDNHFKLIRREAIDSPLGKLDTLVVEKARDHDNGRHTLFWISPKLNYMLVKAKHIENPVLFGEVIMKSYAGPHQPAP